jgi:hypothetical protein
MLRKAGLEDAEKIYESLKWRHDVKWQTMKICRKGSQDP